MTKHDLKELAAMGAELGAAKAENEKLRGLLTTAWRLRPDQHYHEDHLQAEQKAWEVETAEVLNAADALPQQAEPTDAFTAVDMATAAAQGFRDGQAAVEQAPVQDEREAVERFSPTTSVPHCGRASEVEAYMTEDDDGEYMTVSQHERIVAALTRPAQTEQQPVARVAGNEIERYLRWEDGVAAFDLEIGAKLYADPIAQTALSAVTAERDRLQQFEAAYNEWHDKTEWVQKTAEAHELGKHRADVLKERVDQIQAEVEALRKVIRAALYYVPEHKHDLRKIMSAAMAAKEA